MAANLKIKPPIGTMPVLQFVLPSQLAVDPAYQRSIEGSDSQKLINRIAQAWNWDLCQPLVVSRRADGSHFVIDGQHRLEAARRRGDIAQLPAVVVAYPDAAAEAASFVALNKQRRPLSRLEVFKGAVASGDREAVAILGAIEGAGLSLAPHSNFTAWKPGAVSNIGGIEAAWRKHGEKATARALQVLAEAFAGQVLQYAGTIFPGIAAIVADEYARGRPDASRLEKMQTMLCLKSQADWRRLIELRKAETGERYNDAAAGALRQAWRVSSGDMPAPAARPPKVVLPPVAPKAAPAPAGPIWCSQCEERVQPAKAMACESPFCKAKAVAA